MNSNFDTFMSALLEQIAGVAYQREGGISDVHIDIKLDHLEGALEENMKFFECAIELVGNAQKKNQ